MRLSGALLRGPKNAPDRRISPGFMNFREPQAHGDDYEICEIAYLVSQKVAAPRSFNSRSASFPRGRR